jgi:hypothetical protein
MLLHTRQLHHYAILHIHRSQYSFFDAKLTLYSQNSHALNTASALTSALSFFISASLPLFPSLCKRYASGAQIPNRIAHVAPMNFSVQSRRYSVGDSRRYVHVTFLSSFSARFPSARVEFEFVWKSLTDSGGVGGAVVLKCGRSNERRACLRGMLK